MFDSYYPQCCFTFSLGIIVVVLIHTYRNITETWEDSKLWTPVYTIRND